MKKLLAIILILAISIFLQAKEIDLAKSKHTTQESISSLYPKPASENIYPHSDIKLSFNVALDEKSIKPSSFKLKQIDKKKRTVDGKLSYITSNNQLLFSPTEFLQGGIYELELNNIKASKENKNTNIKNIKYRFSVADVTIESLNINPNQIELNQETNTSFETYLTYSDSTKIDVKADSCSIKDNTIATIDANSITSQKEGKTTLTCNYKSLTTQADIEVYLEINGHRLPPQPDEELNNSTLLGIDINNNDVRDDVERWIYKKYQDKHPIHIDIAMQAGRGYKKVLETPERAREITKEVSAARYCSFYYRSNVKYFKNPISVSDNIINNYFIEKIYFNTEDRYDTYMRYDKLLSGGVYKLPKRDERKSFCDFNTSKYEE